MKTPQEIAPPQHIIQFAIEAGCLSPCQSKRGVAIWLFENLISTGYNRKVLPFHCNSSDDCKASCRIDALHAEQDAILIGKRVYGAEMLHVKVIDGKAVPSGEPSCVQCSKLICAAGISFMWLLHEDGWRRYSVPEFHRLSVEYDRSDRERRDQEHAEEIARYERELQYADEDHAKETREHVASEQRMRDLLRYCREQLFNEDLISRDEYADLLTNQPGAVKRLAGYDAALANLKREHVAELKQVNKRLDKYSGWEPHQFLGLLKEHRQLQDSFKKLDQQRFNLEVQQKALVEALTRAERKLNAYIGVCKDDKELTNAVLPMARAAISLVEQSGPAD